MIRSMEQCGEDWMDLAIPTCPCPDIHQADRGVSLEADSSLATVEFVGKVGHGDKCAPMV